MSYFPFDNYNGIRSGKSNGKDNEYESKKSEDNFIANRKFTSCYNIKILNRFMEKKYMLFSLNFA